MISTMLVAGLLFQQPFIDRKVGNAKLGQALPNAGIYNLGIRYIVSDDGKMLWQTAGAWCDRYWLESERALVGETLHFFLERGKIVSLTMSQSAHAVRPAQSLRIGTPIPLSAPTSTDLWLFVDANGHQCVSHVFFDKRGLHPNRDVQSPDRHIWALSFASVGRSYTVYAGIDSPSGWSFATYVLSGDNLKRTARSRLPAGLHPLDYDPKSRRLVGLNKKNKILYLYHVPSKSLKKMSLPEDADYFFTRGKLHRQANGPLYVFENNAWRKVFDNYLIAQSANDKYWLIERQEGSVWLREYR